MYTDVFGSSTLPPSEYGFNAITLTTDATLVWPYNTEDADYAIAKILQITCGAGNAVTLPDARQVSTGEDFLIRNVGANDLIVKDASGVQIASVAVGAASYFYLTDNSTLAGVFGVIGFGVGTSTVDAASLVGYGIKAVGASLNQSHPVLTTASGITLSADHRSKLVVFTGGTATFPLTAAGTLGDDYFTMFRNDGTGTATIDPASSELVDGMSSIQVQPGESLILICTGTQWYSVGYGRSTLYQFTQLTKDVSVGGTITLSAAEAANKLITFIGNPAGAVNVVVPSVVAVYYTQSSISTAQTVTLKTAAGSGVGITQGARIIALCDGTNVVSAQSAIANASVSLTDGSANVPSLFFATQTNTGLFKSGTQDLGVAVNGSSVGAFGSTGLQTSTVGPNSTQRHTLPAVTSDTVTLNAATQTLTNKTLSVDNNTVSGIAASSFVLSNASGNIDGTAAQKAIPTGVVVGTTDSQTLTNKTLTAPVISSISNTGTLTLPTSTDTLVGRATTDTLTNKTVNLTNNTLSGTKAQFDTALSDDNFAYVGQANTFTTNQTLTVNSTSPALKITQTGTGNALVVEDAASDTTPFVIDQNGILISGHTSAVNTETGAPARIQVLSNPALGVSSYAAVNFTNDVTGSGIYLGKSRSTTVGTFGTIVQSGDVIGAINFAGDDSAQLRRAAQIIAAVDGTPGPNNMPGRLVFSTTADGASSPTERMRIDSVGNVGIGTSAAGNKLHIGGSYSGATATRSIVIGGVIDPAVSSVNHIGAYIVPSVATGTLPALYSNYVGQGAFTGTVTTHYGYIADNLTGATNNYGFYSNIPAGTGRYNFYAAGTADNIFNGNVLVKSAAGLGYGTGAGGQVTQVTSKSTGVTLNTPTGQITMNNAALAAGASVVFQLTNLLASINDTIIVNINGGLANSATNYSVKAASGSGAVFIVVKNESAGSLSEAVIINFAIIKGATA